ncbi:hypothetical protein BpHYR1_054300 [Brachionus plicatilis]|uniref:Uncharacterized protein n=1 Tax=Brachionus plicatilis TaxID=10195 RepID=A0A3M7QTX7_BRAPC|nr:hypothetical protein BpHYR1_054300 [Brachionus plicatilis]
MLNFLNILVILGSFLISVAIIANLQKTSSASLSTTKTYYTAWHHFFSSHGNMAPFCYKIIPLLLQFPTFPPLSSHAQPFFVSTSKHCPLICIANPEIKNIKSTTLKLLIFMLLIRMITNYLI